MYVLTCKSYELVNILKCDLFRYFVTVLVISVLSLDLQLSKKEKLESL